MAGGRAGETVLRLSGITRRFGAVLANDGITFALARGEVVALLGENGAGKTTLMNILFGHYVADSGSVEVFGRPLPPGDPRAALAAGIGMVHQHFTLAENLTVLDNILLGTEPLFRAVSARARARARLAALAEGYGLAVEPDRRVATLSVGERQRVEILKALWRAARILILDEPTAVLTPQEAEALFATLRRLVADGLSVIFISHKLHEVLAIADRIVVLRQGRVAGELPAAGATRGDLARLMVGADVALPAIPAVPEGPVLLDLAPLAPGGAPLELRGGRITGIAGISGNGQAALAALLAGLVPPPPGALRIGGLPVGDWSPRRAIAAGIARIPEDRHAEGTVAAMSIAENAVLERFAGPPFARAGLVDWRGARAFARALIRAYDIRCEGPDQRIGLLSGGNMQKLILGRVLEGAPRIILASQPTRGLDIGATAHVHARLLEARARGAAILLVSEDLDEILALSDRIQVISRGRLSPATPRGALSVPELGALMAGHGFPEAEAPHAA